MECFAGSVQTTILQFPKNSSMAIREFVESALTNWMASLNQTLVTADVTFPNTGRLFLMDSFRKKKILLFFYLTFFIFEEFLLYFYQWLFIQTYKYIVAF